MKRMKNIALIALVLLFSLTCYAQFPLDLKCLHFTANRLNEIMFCLQTMQSGFLRI